MEKADAEKLMKIYERAGSVLSEADLILRKIEDEAERKSFLYPLGEMLANIWDNLERPIVNMFPELDPDKDSDWHQEQKNKSKAKIAGSCNRNK